jgi:hypothetical protein
MTGPKGTELLHLSVIDNIKERKVLEGKRAMIDHSLHDRHIIQEHNRQSPPETYFATSGDMDRLMKRRACGPYYSAFMNFFTKEQIYESYHEKDAGLKRIVENWSKGKSMGTVITDNNNGFRPKTGHDDVGYYGGHLICESVWRKKDVSLIAAAPNLLNACLDVLHYFEGGSIDKEELILQLRVAIIKAHYTE